MRLHRSAGSETPVAVAAPTPRRWAALLEARRTSRSIALIRFGVGVAMVAVPTQVTGQLGTDAMTSRRLDWLTRMVGGREITLAVGTLSAMRSGIGARGWLRAAVIADAIDAVAFAAAVKEKKMSPVMGALSGGAAIGAVVGGFSASRQLGRLGS